LAELAVMFGHFGLNVGDLWLGSLQGRLPFERIARVDSKPIYRHIGQLETIEFYSCDHELSVYYDCRINFAPSGLKLDAKRLSD